MKKVSSDQNFNNVDVVKKVVLTRDSGFMSLINKKLHGEKVLDKDTFMEEMMDDERKSLQQAESDYMFKPRDSMAIFP